MKHILIVIILILLLCCQKDKIEPTLLPTSIVNLDLGFTKICESDSYNSVCFVDTNTGFVAGYDGVISKTIDGGYNWISLESNTSITLYDIYFLNASEGFVVSGESGCGGTGCIPEGGIILYTNDGGQTWSELNNSPSDIFDMYFTNELEGFAFGRGNYSGGDFGHSYGSIFHTIDGGEHWTGSSNVHETGVIVSVSFPSNKKGYALSQNIIIRITAD